MNTIPITISSNSTGAECFRVFDGELKYVPTEPTYIRRSPRCSKRRLYDNSRAGGGTGISDLGG